MDIQELDGHIDKNLYKTAYETDRKAQIDVAAAFQKHVDQAISRNMYLEEKDRANMYDVYMYAWKKQIKGTYYCFIEKKLQGEKYTQSVNKSEGRVGFGARTAVADTVASTTGFGARMTPIVATAAVVEDKMTEVDTSVSSDLLHGGLTREQIREKLIAEK
jgi:ribonucleotide reductase alpha subunit